jgi:hypothetical protein
MTFYMFGLILPPTLAVVGPATFVVSGQRPHPQPLIASQTELLEWAVRRECVHGFVSLLPHEAQPNPIIQ